MTNSAEQIARAIVEAELSDNWFLAGMLKPRLTAANQQRRALGLKPIRATQHWYFELAGNLA
jgi:hypothetical protein